MRNGLIGLAGALLFAGTLAAVGCGSDDDGGDGAAGGSAGAVSTSGCTKAEGGTEITAFCGAAPLNTLTQAEAVQLCGETSVYLVSSISRASACKYFGIVSAASNSSPTVGELQAACSSSEGSCNRDASVMGPGANTLCGQVPATCTATVAQYSACVMEEAVVFDQAASALVSCSALTFENLSTVYDVPNAAAAASSCMTLKMACPNFTLPYIN